MKNFGFPVKFVTWDASSPRPENVAARIAVVAKDGVPALLSFAQWGSAYTGTDEDEAEDAMDHAMVQAEALANEQLTTFINSTITVSESSDKGEAKTTDAVFDSTMTSADATAAHPASAKAGQSRLGLRPTRARRRRKTAGSARRRAGSGSSRSPRKESQRRETCAGSKEDGFRSERGRPPVSAS